ncbi:hypothetical protein O181_027734 [Austropuccinia psidii MF-1]|uniref:Velvet domain-containing protein n=1 Tax=Austropuccinia psidii MF-1 TaxID=1389203 RepID=A0A9Q3H2W5_9BASI|nr:hypothetical protein [Austropuccinia psidii MF-1]
MSAGLGDEDRVGSSRSPDLQRQQKLTLIQAPTCGCRIDEIRHPRQSGQLPVVPAIVVQLGQAHPPEASLPIPLTRLRCTLTLMNHKGEFVPQEKVLHTEYEPVFSAPSIEDPNLLSEFFIFDDVMIRDCGRYTGKFTLFEMNDDVIGQPVLVRSLVDLMCPEFTVVEYADFPIEGTIIATPLTIHLNQHGRGIHCPPF